MRFVFGLAASFAVMATAGCEQAAPLRIEGASVRLPAVAGNPAAAYFTVRGGTVADRLLGVSSPMAIKCEMHDMGMAGGMMTMQSLADGVAVPAGATVTFAPSGKHVMLFDVSPRAAPGRTMPLTLRFASGVTIETQAKIVAANDPAK